MSNAAIDQWQDPGATAASVVNDWLDERVSGLVGGDPFDRFASVHGDPRRLGAKHYRMARRVERPDRHRAMEGVTLPAWIKGLVPVPFSMGATLRACLGVGCLIRGTLTRCPIPDISLSQIAQREGTYHVADFVEPWERRLRDQWSDESKISVYRYRRTSMMLTGLGVVGALDGLITSPMVAYPDLPWTSVPLPVIAVSRMLAGAPVPEISQVKATHAQAWFHDFGHTVRSKLVVLWSIREIDNVLYQQTVTKMITDALLSWGPCGWLYHELESGDVAKPEDAVCIARAVEFADRAIDLYIADYHKNLER